jgi:cysteine desulfurase
MPVYLDHNATAPLDPAVLAAMLPYLERFHGNASSAHAAGRAARAAIERAREQVAALAGARPAQVIFTGSGTEANNLALKGIAATLPPGALAVSAIEHSSVLAPARALEAAGWRPRLVDPDGEGRIDPEAFAAVIGPDTRLASVMAANNETGVIQDIAALARCAQSRGVLFHSDAIQAAGRIPLDMTSQGIHLMSLAAHKIGGPKGVGALIVDAGVDVEPLLHGGGQERGRRSGTENVAGIVGFGVAAERAASGIAGRGERLRALRDRLEGRLSRLPGVAIFGAAAERLPNTTFFASAGLDGQTLVLMLDRAGFEVGSGSACGSARAEPSHVLLAMGVERDLAQGAVRVSLGAGNTEREVDAFAATLEGLLGSLPAGLAGTGTL